MFLHNEEILKKIADSCKIRKSDVVLEIGGGKGQLTKYLAKSAERVIVCELDKMLLPYLRGLGVEIVNKSILDYDIPKDVTLIVGNIPYHLSSLITEKILKAKRRAVILYQSEFADRITGKAGTKNYSRISVLAQALSSPKQLFDVNRNNFTPVPKVDSTLVEFIPNNEEYDEGFFKFTKILFQFKNKSVKNALVNGRRMWTKEEDKRKLKPLLEKMSSSKVYTLGVEDLKREYGLFKQ